MIPRTLVPPDARPPAPDPSAAPSRRRPSSMDERTLIPPALPIVRLDGRTNIPTSLPLESIAARVIVPRDLKLEAILAEDGEIAAVVIPTELDERIAVPTDAAPLEEVRAPEHVPLDLVEGDIFTTGDVQFLAAEQKDKTAKWNLITNVSSVGLHVLAILAIIFGPSLFPARHNPNDSMEMARQRLTLLLPPGLLDAPKSAPRPVQPPSEAMRVDPRILRRVAPPTVEPQPAPGPREPERVTKELPSAPAAQPSTSQPAAPTPKAEAPRAPLKLESPGEPQPNPNGLILPKLSPGRSIEQSIRDAAKGSISAPIASGGQLPGGGGAGAPGVGGSGAAYGSMEMLTPNEGVDFSTYLARVYTSVKQNWFAVMPESVRLGDRGMVVLQFRILRNGNVPTGEPVLMRTSGKEPLDRAAFSSIRASNPFQPLPPAFSGPYIELRFTYLYNLPLSYAQQP